METVREKWDSRQSSSKVDIEENKIIIYSRFRENCGSSYRVYRGGLAGIYNDSSGSAGDEDGFALAEKNLAKKRSYPYQPEANTGSRDLTEQLPTEKELIDTAKECLEWLTARYQDYTFFGGFAKRSQCVHFENNLGMDLTAKDGCVSVGISFKHKDSREAYDGGFDFDLRTFDKQVFFRMADDYLANFRRQVKLPEDVVMNMRYYGFLGCLTGALDAENLARGTSLLAGRMGEKVFSEDFTFVDDLSDEEAWMTAFWDGEGCVREDPKLVLIDHGVVKTGYSNKLYAEKYGVPHTRSATYNYGDVVMGEAVLNPRIARSKKTIKELLDGRSCVIPLVMTGGGFNEKGDYVMPVMHSLLFDGEQVVGSLPPFTMTSSMFDMFGKDFIGVGSDQPVYHDKSMLFRVGVQRIL